MKAPRFVSIAGPERPRLAGPASTLALALAMSAVLLAVFPAQSLEYRLATTPEVDPVSLAYLRSWLRAKPDDYFLRLVFARQELQKGDLDAVVSTLHPLLMASDADPGQRTEAELLLLDTRERQLWRTGPGTPAFAAARQAYLVQLRQVAEDYEWPNARLQNFADGAYALGDVALGRELYLHLIRSDPANSFGRVDRLVQMDVANGNYQDAAALSFWILPYTRDLNQRRQYFLGGLKILVSGNRVNEAIDASEAKMGPLVNDPQTLIYVIQIALAGQRPDVAARYTARLLQQRVAFGEGGG